MGLPNYKHASLRRPEANYKRLQFKKRKYERRLALGKRCGGVLGPSHTSGFLGGVHTDIHCSYGLGVALPVRLKRERLDLPDFPSARTFVVDNNSSAHPGFNEWETFLAVHARKLRCQFASDRVATFRARNVPHDAARAHVTASFWLGSSHKWILSRRLAGFRAQLFDRLPALEFYCLRAGLRFGTRSASHI